MKILRVKRDVVIRRILGTPWMLLSSLLISTSESVKKKRFLL